VPPALPRCFRRNSSRPRALSGLSAILTCAPAFCCPGNFASGSAAVIGANIPRGCGCSREETPRRSRCRSRCLSISNVLRFIAASRVRRLGIHCAELRSFERSRAVSRLWLDSR
jgi:hypothetical protein